MRNLEKGQHIFIAFQNGKAVLDSQLRPRIYTSLENADKWTPTVDKGKIEYVEYAPTLTPPNEWVSVEERLPEESDGMVLLTDGISVRTGYRNWMFRMDDYPIVFVPGQKKGGGEMAVTHWMKISAPPNRRPPEGEGNA